MESNKFKLNNTLFICLCVTQEELLAPKCLSHKEHQPLTPQSHEVTLTTKSILITFQYRRIPNDFITIECRQH
jgi:hypothetical protein